MAGLSDETLPIANNMSEILAYGTAVMIGRG